MRWRSGNATVCKTAMRGFDSRPHLHKKFILTILPCIVGAAVVELEYTTDLRSVARKGLRVRLPPAAPLIQDIAGIHLLKNNLTNNIPSGKFILGIKLKELNKKKTLRDLFYNQSSQANGLIQCRRIHF